MRFLLLAITTAFALLPICGFSCVVLADSVLAQPSGRVEIAENFLSLREALDEALTKSPRAAFARAQLPIAKSNYAQASVMPNPTFLYLQNFRADQVTEVGVTIPVEPPWKLIFRLLAAKKLVEQADAEIFLNLWTLRAEVRRAYLDYVITQELVALQTELTNIYRDLAEIAQTKVAAGAVPRIEFEKARLATEQAEIEQDRQGQRVILTKQHLNIIMGRSVDRPTEVPRLSASISALDKTELLPDFSKELKPLSDFLVMAENTAPQLKVLRQTIKANKANLNTSIGNIAPNPMLSFGHLRALDIGPTSGVMKGYFIGAGVDLPVLDFQQGNIARTNALIKQLKAETLSQQNIITDQVANAYRRLVIARRVTKSYQEKVLQTSDRVVQMTKESYQYGRSDITAALVAAQLNIDTRTRYLTAIAEYQQALTDLEQAVGSPLD